MGGGMCGPIYVYNCRCMQTSKEWRDPTRLETSVSLHGDYLKSDQLEAVNRGEEYLRGTFEFCGALIHYISYYTYVVLL